MWLAAVINLAAKAFTFFSLMPLIFTLFIGKEQVLAPQWVTQKVAYCYKQIKHILSKAIKSRVHTILPWVIPFQTNKTNKSLIFNTILIRTGRIDFCLAEALQSEKVTRYVRSKSPKFTKSQLVLLNIIGFGEVTKGIRLQRNCHYFQQVLIQTCLVKKHKMHA